MNDNITKNSGDKFFSPKVPTDQHSEHGHTEPSGRRNTTVPDSEKPDEPNAFDRDYTSTNSADSFPIREIITELSTIEESLKSTSPEELIAHVLIREYPHVLAETEQRNPRVIHEMLYCSDCNKHLTFVEYYVSPHPEKARCVNCYTHTLEPQYSQVLNNMQISIIKILDSWLFDRNVCSQIATIMEQILLQKRIAMREECLLSHKYAFLYSFDMYAEMCVQPVLLYADAIEKSLKISTNLSDLYDRLKSFRHLYSLLTPEERDLFFALLMSKAYGT